MDSNGHNISSNKSCDEHVYGIEERIQTISLGLLFLLSFIGNAAILRYIFVKKNLHTSTFILIANNAIVDFFITIFVIPMCFTVSILRFWPLDIFACQIFGFIDMTLYTGSLVSLSAISVMRYFATACINDRNYHKKISIKTAKIMIAIVWAYSITWASFPLMGWNDYKFYISKLMCNMNHNDEHNYEIVSSIFTTLLPGMLLLYCSARIVIAIHQHSKQPHLTEQVQAQRPKVERKVATTLAMVILAYAFCTLPQIAIGSIYKFSEDDEELCSKYKNIKIMATIIYLSNCAINPIIYGVVNENLRKAFIPEKTNKIFNKEKSQSQNLTGVTSRGQYKRQDFKTQSSLAWVDT